MLLSNEQRELLKLISTIDFAVDEAVLFLDTHPNDEEALAYYDKYRKLLEQGRKEYTQYFGPLMADDVNVKNNEWTWATTPWPWEREN